MPGIVHLAPLKNILKKIIFYSKMIIRFAKELVSFYSPLLPPNDEEAPALEHGSGHRDLD